MDKDTTFTEAHWKRAAEIARCELTTAFKDRIAPRVESEVGLSPRALLAVLVEAHLNLLILTAELPEDYRSMLGDALMKRWPAILQGQSAWTSREGLQLDLSRLKAQRLFDDAVDDR
jgi:hypothetical protein